MTTASTKAPSDDQESSSSSQESSSSSREAIVLTPAGEGRLRTQLSYLRRQLQVDFPARLKEARSGGGGDQNDDVLQAMEEEAVVAAAVRRIEDLLADAEVVDDKRSPGRIVTLGAIVEVEDLDSELVRSYELVGAFEEVANGVSMSSPMGKALIGLTIGEEARVALPTGGIRRLKVVSVG